MQQLKVFRSSCGKINKDFKRGLIGYIQILEKITPNYDENQECEIVEVSLKNGDRVIKKTKLDLN